MSDKKTTLIQSSRGSVFSTFGEEKLKQITEESKRKVAVSGKINKPGIVEVPENATLNDIIELCGGILDKKKFKASQLGIPFGGFLTEDSLDKVLDFNLFDKEKTKNGYTLKNISHKIQKQNLCSEKTEYNVVTGEIKTSGECKCNIKEDNKYHINQNIAKITYNNIV